MENLIRCGALRSLEESEPALLLKLRTYFKNSHNKTTSNYLTKDLDLPSYSKELRIVSELELLGFGVTGHPLTLYHDIIPWQKMVSSLELEKYKNKRVSFTGWYVTNRTTQIKDGSRMLFLTLEDLHGFCDIVFFPEMFEKHREVIRGHGPFTVLGKMQSRITGEANLIAEKILRWPAPTAVVNKKLQMKHTCRKHRDNVVNAHR